MEPVPQTKELGEECDPSPLTEVAIINPGIAMLIAHPSIKVVLARNVIRENKMILLQGARLIELPLGARLQGIRFLARFWSARLPDEFEYGEIQIDHSSECAVAKADGDFICPVKDPNLIVSLTGREYFQLLNSRGRDLHRWVGEQFGTGDGLVAKQPSIAEKRRAA